MGNTIEHVGEVVRVDDLHVQVRIVQTSACSACVIRGHCNAAESQEKIIDVFNLNFPSLKVGDVVKLEGTTSMGMKAVMWSFGVPFLVVFIVLLICKEFLSLDDMNSGLLSLASLIPYYGILYLFRNRFAKKFSFTIKPINN
ncbi:MAG: SoxR reducing system RseC family protein [Bacteroidaceae bacterium]|nr:SoxR reducing system RseC family protein [Bacteroidaceae bacterium]